MCTIAQAHTHKHTIHKCNWYFENNKWRPVLATHRAAKSLKAPTGRGTSTMGPNLEHRDVSPNMMRKCVLQKWEREVKCAVETDRNEETKVVRSGLIWKSYLSPRSMVNSILGSCQESHVWVYGLRTAGVCLEIFGPCSLQRLQVCQESGLLPVSM